jgi:hypothetical protein
MRRRHSPWPNTTVLCSGDEHSRETVDGVTVGEVRSETGQKGLFHQHDDGFACIRSRGTSHGDLVESAGRPFCPSGAPRRAERHDRRIIPG